ncbi:MAG: coenzyme F420-0:L-glutamate ligase [Candidatus Bathyarchaeota archaeon]|nr:MAG: coenzyme F420-0:L-glutamate ligase [Candidatus Bathyarchaeota archaeon]
MVKKVCILGLQGLPLIKAGDDLANLIVRTAKKNDLEINDGDILVIAQKVISKVEGRLVRLDSIKPSKRALKIAETTGKAPRLVELVLRESKRLLKSSREILIVEDTREIVNINAGIDKSNINGRNQYSLLPKDPDKSARQIRLRIKSLTGKSVGVIISDTYSRAFRRGQVNFTIGLAGVNPFIDYRGKEDLFGYVMQVKFSAIADELASAAELVMGQGKEAIPVVIIRGLDKENLSENFSSKDLIIGEKEDLFKNVWQ